MEPQVEQHTHATNQDLPLDRRAAALGGVFSHKLIDKELLAKLAEIAPGLGEKLGEQGLEKLVSAELGKAFRAKLRQRTPESLTAAVSALEVLEVLARKELKVEPATNISLNANLPKVPGSPAPLRADGTFHETIKLLGKNYIGPEAFRKLFGTDDVGLVPELPKTFTSDLLNSEAPYFEPRGWGILAPKRPYGLIKDTHRLVFIPATVDGRPFCLSSFSGFVKRKIRSLSTDAILKEIVPTAPWGKWLLLPERDFSKWGGFWDKSHMQQKAELYSVKPYRAASVLELVTAITMAEVQNDEYLYYYNYYRCVSRYGIALTEITDEPCHRVLKLDKNPARAESYISLAVVRDE